MTWHRVRRAGCAGLLAAATAVAPAALAQGVALELPAGTALVPASPLDPAEATRRLARYGPIFDIRCRAGAGTEVHIGTTPEPWRSRIASSPLWALRLVFKVAPHLAVERPLRPGECRLPTPDFVDAPIVQLWRFVETEPGVLDSRRGLSGLWVAPERGIIEVTTVDPVFQALAFRASDSRLRDGLLSVGAPGGGTRALTPGEPFALRIARMPCERRCTGYRPPTWEFYVVAAPIP